MPKGRRPHDVVADVPPDQLVRALVRNLADGLGGQAACRVPVAGELVTVATWPERPPAPPGGWAEAVRVPVLDGGTLLVAGVRRWGGGELAMLRETAAWIGVAAGLDRLRGDRDRAESRARGLRAELARARERLTKVRDLERRRLVQAITSTTLRDLDDVRGRLRALDGATDHEALARELDAVRGAIDDLLDRFRAVVRGVYPAMLPDRGPTAALAELAAALPRPVRFAGDLGRRVGWEVESGLYHGVAAVLTVLAALPSDRPISVGYHRTDALVVRITADTAGTPAPDLRAALAPDAERLAVLGGALECAAADDGVAVTVRVAERIEPEAAAARPSAERCALYRRVRELVRRGRQSAGDGSAAAAWDAVADRMSAAPRIAVVGGPEPEVVPDGVDVLAVAGPADRALAEELAADDGPRGGADAVLCLVAPAPAFRAALRAARQRVLLTQAGTVADLARALVARAPVLAARRALVAAAGLAAALPASHPVRFAADRIAAEAHELAELDLLDALHGGEPALLRGAEVDAARLLGAHGTDPRTRLGLPDDAADDVVAAAAERAAGRWRAHAEHPGTGGRDRMACQVLARTAEGLLTRGRIR